MSSLLAVSFQDAPSTKKEGFDQLDGIVFTKNGE
jgi:hypothetical protein